MIRPLLVFVGIVDSSHIREFDVYIKHTNEYTVGVYTFNNRPDEDYHVWTVRYRFVNDKRDSILWHRCSKSMDIENVLDECEKIVLSNVK